METSQRDEGRGDGERERDNRGTMWWKRRNPMRRPW